MTTPRLSSAARPGWLAAIAAIYALSAGLYLLLPPSPDQLDHGYSAWRTLNGAVPYRDVMDVNWPGVIGLHALSLSIFGVHLWSWRALDFILMLPAAWCLADLVRQSVGDLGGRIALVVFPLLYVSAGYWVAGQKDMTAGLFLLVALWFHVRGYTRGPLALHAASGACIGLAVLNKPTLAVLWPMLPLHALGHGFRLPKVLAATLVNGLSCVLAVAAAVLCLLALGTTLNDFTDMVLTYQRFSRSLGVQAFARVPERLLRFQMSGFLTLTIAACLPIWYWLFFKRGKRTMAATALPLLWLAGLVSAVVQAQGYGYHLSATLLAAIGALSIGFVPVVSAVTAREQPAWRRAAAVCVVALVAGGIALRLEQSYGGLAGFARTGSLDAYLEEFQGEAGTSLSLAEAVAFVRRIDAESAPGCVFFVGESSAINLLARRAQPTRFHYLPTMMHAEPPLPMAARWNELWARDLARADCGYVLVSHKKNAAWLEGPAPAAAALRQLLARYEQVGALGRDGAVLVFRRRDNPEDIPK